MNSIAIAETKMSILEDLLDSLLKSATPSEFCRALVHSDYMGQETQGAHLFTLDQQSQLANAASYGLPCGNGEAISIWDNNPLGEAIRSKSMTFDSSHEFAFGKGLACIPLLRESMPLGCLALVIDNSAKHVPFEEELVPLVGKIAAYLVNQNSGFRHQSRRDSAGSPDDLTQRQIRIIEFMAEGYVNAEIARELLVSESTVRQETVRIYRALDVPNRTEAAKKARALGLIKRPPPAIERAV